MGVASFALVTLALPAAAVAAFAAAPLGILELGALRAPSLEKLVGARARSARILRRHPLLEHVSCRAALLVIGAAAVGCALQGRESGFASSLVTLLALAAGLMAGLAGWRSVPGSPGEVTTRLELW